MQNLAVLRFTQISLITGLSRSTIWCFEKQNQFPKRRLLGKNSVGWLSSEIDAWIKSREIIRHD